MENNLRYRGDLQGLRAVAILLVVIAHANIGVLTGGFVGVDVFFVLSGYLITGSLVQEIQANNSLSFVDFYARRFKRLLPSLLFMLLITLLVAFQLLSPVEIRSQVGSFLYALTWTSNLFFSFTHVDYFDELLSKDFFLHTWSLGVEEQFYLIWPLLIAVFFWPRLTGKWRKTIDVNGVLIGLSLLMLFGFLGSVYLLENYPRAAFYMMPSRIWQFSCGALVYFIFNRNNAKPPLVLSDFNQRALLLVGMLFVLFSAIYLTPGFPYPGFWALLPTAGASFIVAAGEGSGSERKLLNNTFLVWLGNRSYSFYLWHWPVFMIGFSLGFDGQPLYVFAMIILSLLAAIITYRLIEIPFWKGRFSHVSSYRALVLSLTAIGCAFLPGYFVFERMPGYDVQSKMVEHWQNDKPVIYEMGCDSWVADARVVPCEFGNLKAQNRVVLVGDSIGVQWFSALQGSFPAKEWRFTVLTKSSCPMIDEDKQDAGGKAIFKNCILWRNDVLTLLDSIRPEVLILGNSATYAFTSEQWVAGSDSIFERTRKSANNVIVIPGTPSLGFIGPSCLTRNISEDSKINPLACVSEGRIAPIELAIDSLQQVASRFNNVHFMNLNEVVCPLGVCRAAVSEKLVVFRDSQHLTNGYVKSLTPVVKERIRQILGEL